MSDYDKNISVIGCGHWGKNLVRNFHALGALHSICDNSLETAEKFAQDFDVPALTWEGILSNSDIKAVVLASPAPFHYKMAKAALEAEKDVYVEKPICLDDAEAKDLCDLAADKNAMLMVGHLLHYHPVFAKMKEITLSQKLGKLHYIYSNRLSFGKIRREENVLWSFAPHDVSMILGLAGGEIPNSVEAIGSAQTHDTIEDFALIKMNFPSGLSAHINVSWLNPFKEQKLVVIGEGGMLVFDDQEEWTQKLIHYPHKIEVSQDQPHIEKSDGIAIAVEQSEPLKNECTHFLECIKTRKTPITDGKEGLSVLNVLNRAEQSMKGKS